MSQRMSDLAQGLYSQDLAFRHRCLKEFRKILSKGTFACRFVLWAYRILQ